MSMYEVLPAHYVSKRSLALSVRVKSSNDKKRRESESESESASASAIASARAREREREREREWVRETPPYCLCTNLTLSPPSGWACSASRLSPGPHTGCRPSSLQSRPRVERTSVAPPGQGWGLLRKRCRLMMSLKSTVWNKKTFLNIYTYIYIYIYIHSPKMKLCWKIANPFEIWI